MTKPWKCPTCKRQFTRPNQRHACGTGDRASVLRNRPPELVAVYSAIEEFVRTLGPVELVARDRYVLFRTKRIFADVVVMAGSIRLAIHLGRKLEHALFSKVVADSRHVTHVALLHELAEVELVEAFLREAYAFSRR
jgi:hypothetical protein